MKTVILLSAIIIASAILQAAGVEFPESSKEVIIWAVVISGFLDLLGFALKLMRDK